MELRARHVENTLSSGVVVILSTTRGNRLAICEMQHKRFKSTGRE